MIDGFFGLILDIVILVFLGITIYYAYNLTNYLKIFRDGRKDFENLVQNMTFHIEKAENAIKGMRKAAEESGQELQDIVDEAKFLSDELKFMNEAGNGLANRLEKLAERNRELVEVLQDAGGVGVVDDEYLQDTPPREKTRHEMPEEDESDIALGFMIQDREFDGFEEDFDEVTEANNAQDDDFKSEAEKEFYRALRKTKKHKARA